VKIALAGAHFHGVGVTRPGSWNTVEKVLSERSIAQNRPKASKNHSKTLEAISQIPE
jgi:hypothetical protein